MMSINDLRKLAELNLCEKCYQKYLALLEPSIKSLSFNPLSDWRKVESYITLLVMKREGVFKSDTIFISIDEDANEKFADEVDVRAFQKIKKLGFKKKIDYLHKNGILQESSHKFLNRVREIRNRIHDMFSEFSEKDLALFHWAKAVTSQIYYAIMVDWKENISENMKSNAENLAQQLLLRING